MRRQSYALVVLATIALGACASGNAGNNAGTAPLPQIRGTNEGIVGIDARRGGTVETHSRVIEVSADSVFMVLPDVYESLKIPFETVLTDQRTLGNQRFVATRTLNGERLSEYFDCGMNPAGHIADQARVQMNILTTVTPLTPTSSQISTRIEANARQLNAANRDPLGCSTRGRLEIIISELAKRRVGR